MAGTNILVIAVDGLRAAALGAYGNTTFPTPALDQFAAESLVNDWCYADSAECDLLYRQMFPAERSPLSALREHGYTTLLLADDPTLCTGDLAEQFDEVLELNHQPAERAASLGETQLAQSFAAIADQLTSATGPRFVWAHCRGFYGDWDAPLELQEELLSREEGDPPPTEQLLPPEVILPANSDPDEAFRWSCAYAAQVIALDWCIGCLQQALNAAAAPWLVVLTGLRGFPLGEHQQIGGTDRRLFNEQLHVPLVVHFPGGDYRLERRSALTSLASLPRQLLAWAGIGPDLLPDDVLFSHSSTGERAIRSADWCLQMPLVESSDDFEQLSRSRLFVRPDDRWEVNDVASLCPEAVELLLARARTMPQPQ